MYNGIGGGTIKTLIVYDSYFGNTKEVAGYLASYIDGDVTLSHVSEVNQVEEFDLLVIGSPTRAFQPTKAIKQLVRSLPKNPSSFVAFFDTRFDMEKVNNRFLNRMVSWFGYANDTLEKRARKLRLNVLLPSGTFYVGDTEGPLEQDTQSNAKEWIQTIQQKRKGGDNQ